MISSESNYILIYILPDELVHVNKRAANYIIASTKKSYLSNFLFLTTASSIYSYMILKQTRA